MEWLNHLNEAVAYMESCLEGEFSLEQAAHIACCSPCYFRRMFGYVMGVSPAEYLHRRRMTQAAFLLQHTGMTVTEVALRYGYASPTAFSRAFRQVHGLTPTEARRAGCALNAWLPVEFSVRVAGARPMPYRIECGAEGRWAVFEAEDASPEAVQAVSRRFFAEWLPFSGWRSAGLPARTVQQMGRAEVWFAITREETE